MTDESYIEILEELKECYRRLEETTREYKERIVRLEVSLKDHQEYEETTVLKNTEEHKSILGVMENMKDQMSEIRDQILIAKTFSRFVKGALVILGGILGFMISQWENILKLFKHT